MLTLQDLGEREVRDASACTLALLNRIDDFLTEVAHEAEVGNYSPKRANRARTEAKLLASLLLASHRGLLSRISGEGHVDRWTRWVERAFASTSQPDIDREGEGGELFPSSRALGEARSQVRAWCSAFDELLDDGPIRDPASVPLAFLSYCRQPPSHAAWVLMLATALIEQKRVDVTLDQWDLVEGESIGLFVERAIELADSVVVVCTPEYKKKADAREGGVGQETAILSARIYDRVAGKVIPVLRGLRSESWPRYLGDRLAVDFTKDDRFTESLGRLADRIYDKRPQKPALGGGP